MTSERVRNSPSQTTTYNLHPPQGKYNPLPTYQGRTLNACEWQRWAMDPPTDGGLEGLYARMDMIFDLGYADARAYLLQERGITIEASSA